MTQEISQPDPAVRQMCKGEAGSAAEMRAGLRREWEVMDPRVLDLMYTLPMARVEAEFFFATMCALVEPGLHPSAREEVGSSTVLLVSSHKGQGGWDIALSMNWGQGLLFCLTHGR
jgi:hypothetical protein